MARTPKLTARWGAWRSDGLRMRFRPRSRIRQTFLLVVPWLNFGALILLYWTLGQRLTLNPGVVFELPRAPFREGLQPGATAVMLSVARPQGQGMETLVFFDDTRFQMSVTGQVTQLRAELARRALQPGGRQLLLLADRRVPHGDVMDLVNLARETGVQRVNVSVKPE
jgi:hypothetical protein